MRAGIGQREGQDHAAQRADLTDHAACNRRRGGPTQRNQLEERPVAHAHHREATNEQGHGRRERNGGPRSEEGGDDSHEDDRNREDAAQLVRQPAAEHAHDAPGQHRAGRVVFRLGLLDAESVVEEGGQVRPHAHVSAERDDVHGIEHPAVRLPQAFDVVQKRVVALAVRRFLGKDEHGQKRQEHEQPRETIDGVPAVSLRELGREERCDGRAAVARPGNAHRQPLRLRWEPAGTQRQSHAEARPGDTQQDAHRQHAAVRIHVKIAERHRHHDAGHLYQRRVLSPDVLGHDAEREPHQRARHRGQRDHQGRLIRGEMIRLGDERCHRPVEHPHGEAKIEVKEGGDECGRMPRLHECFDVGHDLFPYFPDRDWSWSPISQEHANKLKNTL